MNLCPLTYLDSAMAIPEQVPEIFKCPQSSRPNQKHKTPTAIDPKGGIAYEQMKLNSWNREHMAQFPYHFSHLPNVLHSNNL